MTEKLLWAASPVHMWQTHGLGKDLLWSLLVASIMSWVCGQQARPCTAQAAAFLGVNASYGQKDSFSSDLLKMVLLLLFSFSLVVWEMEDKTAFFL